MNKTCQIAAAPEGLGEDTRADFPLHEEAVGGLEHEASGVLFLFSVTELNMFA